MVETNNDLRTEVVNNTTNKVMNDEALMANVPQTGTMAQPVSGNGVVDQNSSPIKDVEKVSEKPEKSYKPEYTEEQTKTLGNVTAICENEIARVSEEKTFYGTKFDNNCIINLAKAYWDGGKSLGTPEVNRTHGRDERKTGESVISYGAQHILIVMTKKMADAAGIKSVRFANDKNKSELPDDAIIFMDGNGRIDWLLSQPKDKWPQIYGVFPSKDSAGIFNLPRAFDVINTEVSVWKTEDFVQKKITYEGDKVHEGWLMINRLVKNGYKYQAACELTTLTTDRIQKSSINSGNDKDIFSHFESAKKIYEALKNKFGEEGTTLKTKAFPMKISELWRKLQKNMGDDQATENFLNFINDLTDANVKRIQSAKSEKGKENRDSIRQNVIEREFYIYAGKNRIAFD